MAASNVLTALFALDAQLAAKSVHAMSDFWREQARRFAESDATTFVACVGRGGAKTQFSVKWCIATTLAGGFDVPAGEMYYYALISENQAEATKTLRIVSNYLRLLGYKNKISEKDTIIIDGINRGIKVLAGRIGAVSGFRCYGYACDEYSKWNGDGLNPADEVLASVRSMTVTVPSARGLIISSPMGRVGEFFDIFNKGTTETQIVAHAASWVANPGGITESHTRALQPDERIWRREFAAEPQSAALAALDADAVERAFNRMGFVIERKMKPARRVIIIDASSGKKDAWTYCIAGYWMNNHLAVAVDGNGRPITDLKGVAVELADVKIDKPILVLEEINGQEGRFYENVSSDEIVDRVAQLAREHGITRVHGDQREAHTLASAFRRKGLTFSEHPWTSQSKVEAVEIIRRYLRDGGIAIAPHKKFREELLSFEEKITASGSLTFSGKKHDDYASLLITAVLTDIAKGLDKSPLKPQSAYAMGQRRILPF